MGVEVLGRFVCFRGVLTRPSILVCIMADFFTVFLLVVWCARLGAGCGSVVENVPWECFWCAALVDVHLSEARAQLHVQPACMCRRKVQAILICRGSFGIWHGLALLSGRGSFRVQVLVLDKLWCSKSSGFGRFGRRKKQSKKLEYCTHNPKRNPGATHAVPTQP